MGKKVEALIRLLLESLLGLHCTTLFTQTYLSQNLESLLHFVFCWLSYDNEYRKEYGTGSAVK